MAFRPKSKLDPKKRYLQIALNSTLDDARAIIAKLPVSDRIIVEAGTPLIKRYGEYGISQIRQWYGQRLSGLLVGLTVGARSTPPNAFDLVSMFLNSQKQAPKAAQPSSIEPYVVADLKTMDRGGTEVELAARAGASAAVALGSAPTETLNAFIDQCQAQGLDAMIDMMNVEFPIDVLRKLKKLPPIVILHRGVDEEQFNREKQIPWSQIQRLKGTYNIMVSIAGGDTVREVQRSIFNSADIAVIWKSVFQNADDTLALVEGFIRAIK